MKTATGNAVLQAYNRAAKTAAKGRVVETCSSAGFIMPKDMPPGEGWQVFVMMTRFSKKILKKKPLTGGLLTE